MRQLQRIPWAVLVFVAAACVPWLGSRFYTFLATDIAILALFAASLNLLLGTTGLVSFGHAAYFGIGAYTCAILMKTYGMPFALGLVAGGINAALWALLFGAFCVRSNKIYFSMLTLAFAQIVWAICFKWNSVTGGEQGFNNVPYPNLDWMDVLPALGDLRSGDKYYLVVLVLTGVAFFLLKRIVGSPFGQILTAIRENPERAEFVGVNVRRYQLAAFVVAGRVRRLRRRAVRDLQSRRIPRLCLLGEVGRGPDHGDPRRLRQLLGPGRGRGRADPAQSADHGLHAVLAVHSRLDPDRASVRRFPAASSAPCRP